MKRKAILLGNTRDLSATPLDMLHFAKFLKSYQGGAWENEELEPLLDKAAAEIAGKLHEIRNGGYDYVIVYFTGHGGMQGDTILEVNPANELMGEDIFLGLAERQLNIFDCCRCTVTTPLNIYGRSRGMTTIDKDLRETVRMEYDELVMNAAPQLVRMYACSEGESSYPSQNGSYYTNNLLACGTELLKTNDVVRVHQCHEATAIATAEAVERELHERQHPSIIPTKCLLQAELPFCFNPQSLI